MQSSSERNAEVAGKLSTESYKGVRDFYPEDAAIQQYIFHTWAKTAESFGFERYDASILEPADMYRAKGAENEELVNEQTYTFSDRGGREVTLRPEMTPTVARMVAAKQRELAFPLRWYSIPNLFRYERPQRGRLREHWQLNCDMFGANTIAADVEVITLAYQTLIDFGATPEMFKIKINNRSFLTELISKLVKQVGDKLTGEQEREIVRMLDRKDKMSDADFEKEMNSIVGKDLSEVLLSTFNSKEKRQPIMETCESYQDLIKVFEGLRKVGVEAEIEINSNLARGFDYYTGTIFEIFDTADENNRALLGGGRYDNLTGMFGGESVSGIGFGMGDVTMRDFLETHNLIPDSVKSTAATITLIPMTAEQNIFAERLAIEIRKIGVSVSTDIGTQKPDKKKARAADRGSKYLLVIGENEVNTNQFTIKNLESNEEHTGDIEVILQFLRG